jgi:hypothetical protein
MNTRNIPGFTADASLYRNTILFVSGSYHRDQSINSPGTVVPAIPFCGNCPEILDRCIRNGGRPYALCRACAIGDCYSGVENPIPPYPWGWNPNPPGW